VRICEILCCRLPQTSDPNTNSLITQEWVVGEPANWHFFVRFVGDTRQPSLQLSMWQTKAGHGASNHSPTWYQAMMGTLASGTHIHGNKTRSTAHHSQAKNWLIAKLVTKWIQLKLKFYKQKISLVSLKCDAVGLPLVSYQCPVTLFCRGCPEEIHCARPHNRTAWSAFVRDWPATAVHWNSQLWRRVDLEDWRLSPTQGTGSRRPYSVLILAAILHITLWIQDVCTNLPQWWWSWSRHTLLTVLCRHAGTAATFYHIIIAAFLVHLLPSRT